MQSLTKILFLLFFCFVPLLNANAAIQDLLEDQELSNEADDEPGFLDKLKNIFNKENPKGNIKIYNYNQEDAYEVKLKTNVSTVINLPENEKITFFTLGDSDSFQAKHNKQIPNLINIKTSSYDKEANLVIKTDIGSVYNFYLSSANSETEIPNFTIYVVKDKDQEEMVKDKILLRDLQANNDYIKKITALDKLNTSYRIKGDKEVSPIFVYDDGKWTYFDFGKSFVSDRLPTAYKVVDKFDSTINTRTEGNLIIAQTLGVEGFTLKNGDKYVCIRPKKSLYEVYHDDRFKN